MKTIYTTVKIDIYIPIIMRCLSNYSIVGTVYYYSIFVCNVFDWTWNIYDLITLRQIFRINNTFIGIVYAFDIVFLTQAFVFVDHVYYMAWNC